MRTSRLFCCLFSCFAALILVGCSDSDAIPPTTETVAPATASLEPSDTTTTDPVESSTETTAVELTREEVEAEIEAFMQEVRVTWHDCAAVPQDCDAETELSKIYSDRLLEVNLEAIDSYIVEGSEARAPSDPNHDRYIVERIDIAAPSDNKAAITYCEVDGWVVFLPGGGPDGSDVVINENLGVSRVEAELERSEVDGRWRVTTAKDTERFDGNESCQ